MSQLQLVSPSFSSSIAFWFFFQFYLQCLGVYLSVHFPSVLSCGQPEWQGPLFGMLCFLLTITRSGHLAEIRWSICMSRSPRILYVSFSRTDSGLCIYHLLAWSNFNLLHNSQCITFPTQSCLVLYSLCANLMHSLIMWLIVSSLSPHNLHLLFCWRLVYSCFDIVSPYGVVLCYYQKRFTFSIKVSLSKPRPSFPVWDFTCLPLEMSIQMFFFLLLLLLLLSLLLLLLLLFILWEFFSSALADGLSQKFEWHQLSSSLRDYSQYFGGSQQCRSLDSLPLSCYFQVRQSLYQSFDDCKKSTNYNWYNRHFHVPQFQCPSKVHVFIPLFTFFQFYFVIRRDSKVHNPASFLFFVDYLKDWSSGWN